jgi:hypothetical protein
MNQGFSQHEAHILASKKFDYQTAVENKRSGGK